MNGLPYYKAYPRDFIEGTIGMPFELKAAYRLSLDLIYMQGGALPDDARYISGLLGCSVKQWNSYRAKLIAMGKIQAKNGHLTNYRAITELEMLAKLQRKQRENATGPRENNDLEKPRLSHTEPDTYTDKRDTIVSPKKSRKSQIHPDAVLSQKQLSIAIEKGHDAVESVAQFLRFRDYCLANGKAYIDWDAAWRNWLNSPFFKSATGDKNGNGNRNSSQGQRADPALVNIARLAGLGKA